MTTNLSEFFKERGIVIKNLDFYQEAVTHNSYANERNIKTSYENLEFLGDAVLQLKSSVFLYKKLIGFNKQGELTKHRKSLVCEESLAYVARINKIGPLVRLGVGEEASNGRNKDKILADVFEALAAAIYLDLGDAAVDNWLSQTLLRDDVLEYVIAENYDYKTEFQELVQSDNRDNLQYVEISRVKNADNSITFVMEACVDGMIYGTGTGLSKKEATQKAAKSALEKYKKAI